MVGGFAASAYSRTTLKVGFLTELSRRVRVLKHRNPSLIRREVELKVDDLLNLPGGDHRWVAAMQRASSGGLSP